MAYGRRTGNGTGRRAASTSGGKRSTPRKPAGKRLF